MALVPNTLVHCVDGKNLVVESGGSITVKSGGTLDAQAGSVINQPAGGITLANISFTGLKSLAADGRNGAGAITLTGAVVGERVILVDGHLKASSTAHSFIGTATSLFESAITVADQIQQSSATDLSGHTYRFLLAPAAAAE